QEGIARQAVGAVNAGGGDFSRREQARNTGASFQIRAHTAHGIVCCRTDRDQIGGDVYVVLQASGVDTWKASSQVVSIEVRQIEIHNRFRGAADFHLVDNGTRYHIA